MQSLTAQTHRQNSYTPVSVMLAFALPDFLPTSRLISLSPSCHFVCLSAHSVQLEGSGR